MGSVVPTAPASMKVTAPSNRSGSKTLSHSRSVGRIPAGALVVAKERIREGRDWWLRLPSGGLMREAGAERCRHLPGHDELQRSWACFEGGADSQGDCEKLQGANRHALLE